MALFRRDKPAPVRPLVASASHVKIGDRIEAKRLRALRQGWQSDAWAYRDAIGEIRYAMDFRANAATRMRVFPAIMADADEPPVRLDEATDVPADLLAAMHEDLQALGSGPLGLRPILHPLSTNIGVAGECYLVGREQTLVAPESWAVRSIDEVSVSEQGDITIRDLPSTGSTDRGGETLDPDTSFVSRVWKPHPRFAALADSELRAVLDLCEELLLLSRSIRAQARSRLAGAGILAVASELSLPGVETTDDPEDDPFFAELARAMLTPISDEGDASALVPLVVRGPAELLDKALKHITLDRPFDAAAAAARAEILGRIATGIDLPREVLTGVADLNHWSAFQVDDNTFRHHLEPHVIVLMDSLTVGYARPMLQQRVDAGQASWSPELLARVCYWYDPVELVSNPDQGKDAQAAVAAGAAGRAALRRYLNLTDDDAPEQVDEVLYALQHLRGVDPHIAVKILQMVAPSVDWPDPDTFGPAAAVGGRPGGTAPEPPSEPAPVGPPPAERPTDVGPPARAASAAAELVWDVTTAPEPIVARGRRDTTHLSRRLVDIDRTLRARLLAACDAAVRRHLERAGARLRSKTARDPALRASITGIPNALVAAQIGPDGIDALGVTDDALLDGDWGDLADQWDAWVARAQKDARHTAARILGLPVDDPSLDELTARQDTARAAGWGLLAASLLTLARQRMHDPNPDAPPLGEHDPNLTVPTSIVRAAVAVAGGAGDVVEHPNGDVSVDIGAGQIGGQIGTGVDVSQFLVDQGAAIDHYTWTHGDTDRPFDPHLSLDGTDFNQPDDEILANTEGWPEVEFFAPGDHQGCSCDAWITWAAGASEEAVAASA